MKNSIVIMALIGLIIFSCDKDEVADMTDQSTSIEKDTHLTDALSKLVLNEDFRNILTRRYRSNGDHGVMLLDDGFNLSYAAFDGENIYFIGGEGTIQAMPNGRAKFSVHTNEPSAAVLNLSTFTTTYSSDCINGPLGTFNYNYISEYETMVFEPIPGLIFTFYMPTGVRASAEVANGHCTISDAQPSFSDFGEFLGCSDASEYKTMRLTPDGDGGSTISMD